MLPTLLHMHLLLLLLYTRYLLSSADEGMHYLFRLPSGIVRYPWNLPTIWRTLHLILVVYTCFTILH